MTINSLAHQLGVELLRLGRRVTTAESCTGGGIAAAITEVAGSSAWFDAGFVTYSNEQKHLMLGVPIPLFEQVGAVSREVVEAMATGAQQRAQADYAVAVSGVTGPSGGTPDKPVGTVWIAWAAGEQCYSRVYLFAGDRHAVRQATVHQALSGLLALCRNENPIQG